MFNKKWCEWKPDELDILLIFVGNFSCFAAPHLTGFVFRLFVRMVEAPLIGPFIISLLKKQNKINEVGLFISFWVQI